MKTRHDDDANLVGYLHIPMDTTMDQHGRIHLPAGMKARLELFGKNKHLRGTRRTID